MPSRFELLSGFTDVHDWNGSSVQQVAANPTLNEEETLRWVYSCLYECSTSFHKCIYVNKDGLIKLSVKSDPDFCTLYQHETTWKTDNKFLDGWVIRKMKIINFLHLCLENQLPPQRGSSWVCCCWILTTSATNRIQFLLQSMCFLRARFCCNLDFSVFTLCFLRVCEAGSEVDSGLHRTWTHLWMGETVGSRTPRTTRCSTCRSAGVISTPSSLMVSVTFTCEDISEFLFSERKWTCCPNFQKMSV